ncbi:MAG: ATP-binding protein [Actinocrinis sp.]
MTSAATAGTDHPARATATATATAAPATAADGGPLPEQRAGTADDEPSPDGHTGCGRASWQFPAAPVHARMARIWLEAWVADRGPGQEAAYRAAVAFSELVTNAVLHGAGPVTVTVQVTPVRIECEVVDAACDLPVVSAAEEDDEHHRGLALVDALTTEWRVRRRPEGGKSVAFVVED